jgi:hypothetical protein
VGDFNGDGQPDLAVANTAGVLVLLNTTIALSIVRSNNAVIISWPFPAAGFTLESKTNLISSNWKPAPELATNNTGRWEVVVPLSQPQRYFRLHKTSAPGIVLNIMRSNNTAIVSWPFPSTGFVLESTTNRVLANWQAPGEAATTNNGRWQVTVPLNQPQRFFRLRQTSPGVSQSRHAVPSEGASLKYVPPGICPSLYASPNALNHHLYQTGRSATVRSRTLTVLIFPWPQVPRDWQGQPNAETTGSPATHRQCETALEPRALGSAGTWVIGFYSHFDFLIGFDLESSWKIHAKAEYAAHHHFC